MSNSYQEFKISVPRAKGALIDVMFALMSLLSMVASICLLHIDSAYKFFICMLIVMIIPAVFFIAKQLLFTEVRLSNTELINANHLTGEYKSVYIDQIIGCYPYRRSIGFTILLRVKVKSGEMIDLLYHPKKMDAYLLPKIKEL